MKLYSLIGYSGASAFVMLVITVVLGITHINFTLHKIAGILTCVFALLHLGLVMYKNIKFKSPKKQHTA
jgi:hypothetical protein